MFENNGNKLRIYGLVMFWLTMIGMGISGLLMIFNEMVFVGIIMIAVGFLVAFLSTLPILALADAAIYAQNASEEIEDLKTSVNELRRMLQSQNFKNPTMKPAAKPAAPAHTSESMAAARAAYQEKTEKLQNDL